MNIDFDGTVTDWNDVIDVLNEAWKSAKNRAGGFADAPFEPTESMDQMFDHISPIEEEAREGIRTWFETRVLPPMSPAANKMVETRFICSRGFVERLMELPDIHIPHGYTLRKILDWLLFDVYADTVQVALDHMRMDILGVRE